MHLVIDIGNTRTKALLFDDHAPVGDVISGNSDTVFISGLVIAHSHMQVVVATVKTLPDELLALFVERKALVVDPGVSLPIRLKYATPAKLGVDRICAAVGAYAQFGGRPLLVIDMGTCITYEVVSADGVYEGGNISPGLNMRFRALATFTSRLPHVAPMAGAQRIGTDTQTAIQAGVQYGIVAELNETIDHLSHQYPDLVTVGTGGDLSLLAHDLKRPIFADPILVLRGLHEILLHNQ